MPNKLQQEQSDFVTAVQKKEAEAVAFAPAPATLPFSGLSGISELLLRSGDFNFRARGKKDEDVVQHRLAYHSLLTGE